MKRKIILHGKLKRLYSDPIYLYVDSVQEAMRGLCQIKGFEKTLREGYYKVYAGDPVPENSLDENVLNFNLGTIDTIHVQPALTGAGGDGIGKAVAGVALIGLSFATAGAAAGVAGLGVTGGGSLTASASFAAATGGIGVSAATIGKIGLALAFQGISSLLSPQVKSPEASRFERPDQRASFFFNGPVNTTEQGGPVPLVYGQVRTGSTVVSTALDSEKLQSNE